MILFCHNHVYKQFTFPVIILFDTMEYSDFLSVVMIEDDLLIVKKVVFLITFACLLGKMLFLHCVAGPSVNEFDYNVI